MKMIELHNLVDGTTTNDSGNVLFLEIDKALANGEKVKISLLGCSSLSSSFLSSSFGEIFDKYGYELIKSHITLVNYTKIMANEIKAYLDRLACPVV